jgi:hypothetical protein
MFQKKKKNPKKQNQIKATQYFFFFLLAYFQELQIGFPEPGISLNEMHHARKAFKTSSP